MVAERFVKSVEGAWGKVLSLTDDLLLGDEKGELVLPFVCELAKLDTSDFGADVGG